MSRTLFRQLETFIFEGLDLALFEVGSNFNKLNG